MISEDEVWNCLKDIPDPEIPVLNIVELGVIRSVQLNLDQVNITLTPTYSGCPAMKHMEQDIIRGLKALGVAHVNIETVYFPPWTTSWISNEARIKLEAYGIAPPDEETERKSALLGIETKVKCPRCKQTQSKLISQFGSTACKALYQCQVCLEPFDYFKCL